MSSDLAIEARGLGKRFSLFDQPSDRLKQVLWGRWRQYSRDFWALQEVDFDIRVFGADGEDEIPADVEYLFGDHITAISDDGDVTFAHAAPRRFDVVVGADGLHSGVRQLAFGDDAAHTRFLGGYLAVLSVPKSLARDLPTHRPAAAPKLEHGWRAAHGSRSYRQRSPGRRLP